MTAHDLLNPYFLRLICFSLAAFFLSNAALTVAISLGSRAAVRAGERLRPRAAARLVFCLRLLPAGLSLFVVAGWCIPSYLWLEPKGTQEQMSYWCWIAALLCIFVWAISISRFFRAWNAAIRFTRSGWREDPQRKPPVEASHLLVIDSDASLLAVAGVMRSQIVVSSRVLRELSCEELDAAVAHERAHQASRDNLKRLLMLLAPEAFPFFHGFATLEKGWARFTERAADDQAVAEDSGRCVSLASALVRVARLGLPFHPADLPVCFVADSADLSVRVDRLLRDKTGEELPGRGNKALMGAIVVIVALVAVAAVQPPTLYAVHQALEHLVR